MCRLLVEQFAVSPQHSAGAPSFYERSCSVITSESASPGEEFECESCPGFCRQKTGAEPCPGFCLGKNRKRPRQKVDFCQIPGFCLGKTAKIRFMGIIVGLVLVAIATDSFSHENRLNRGKMGAIHFSVSKTYLKTVVSIQCRLQYRKHD